MDLYFMPTGKTVFLGLFINGADAKEETEVPVPEGSEPENTTDDREGEDSNDNVKETC